MKRPYNKEPALGGAGIRVSCFVGRSIATQPTPPAFPVVVSCMAFSPVASGFPSQLWLWREASEVNTTILSSSPAIKATFFACHLAAIKFTLANTYILLNTSNLLCRYVCSDSHSPKKVVGADVNACSISHCGNAVDEWLPSRLKWQK